MIEEEKIRKGYSYFLKLVESGKLDVPYLKDWLVYLKPVIPIEKEATRSVEEVQAKIKAMLESKSHQEPKSNDVKVENMAYGDVEDLFR
jgi:hypothetical protein